VSTRFGLQVVEKCFAGKRLQKSRFDLPKSSFGRGKMFCVFCNKSSPKSSTHTLAKGIENTRPIVCSFFQNLHLGSMEWYW
jgi:hypothetical protein